MIVLWERIEHTTYLESCNRNAIFAEASNDINDEKWHPAQQEDTHDNPNGDCSLYLRIGEKKVKVDIMHSRRRFHEKKQTYFVLLN